MFNITAGDDDDDENNNTVVRYRESGGLSAGAGAGIAVGAIAGALLLAGLGFFLWKRTRKGKSEVAYQQTSEHNVQQQPIQGQQQSVYESSYQLSSSPASQAFVKPELSSESANVHEAP